MTSLAVKVERMSLEGRFLKGNTFAAEEEEGAKKGRGRNAPTQKRSKSRRNRGKPDVQMKSPEQKRRDSKGVYIDSNSKSPGVQTRQQARDSASVASSNARHKSSLSVSD